MKRDFPFFKNYPEAIYMDSAATTLKPMSVVEAAGEYYKRYNSSLGRSSSPLTKALLEIDDSARKKTMEFLGAKEGQIVFNQSATQSLNWLMNSLGDHLLSPGDILLLSGYEHHSMLLPAIRLHQENKIEVKFIPILDDGSLDYAFVGSLPMHKIKCLCVNYRSNVNGAIFSFLNLRDYLDLSEVFVAVDVSQAGPDLEGFLQKEKTDFLAFSGHKFFGPEGLGVSYLSSNASGVLSPFLFGGGMVESVDYTNFTESKRTNRFEAGSWNGQGVYTWLKALEYLTQLKTLENKALESNMIDSLYTGISSIKGVKLVPGPSPNSIISFEVSGLHPHDMAHIFTKNHLFSRAGFLCAEPAVKSLGFRAVNRLSLSVYNDLNEIDKCVELIKKSIVQFYPL